MIKLNETPIRTSENYNINDIKFENLELPEEIGEFENCLINGENSKIKIDENTSEIKLIYGLGKELTEYNKNNSNKKIKINIDSKTNKDIQIDFNFDDENINLVEDIEIIASENTNSTIYIRYMCEKDINVFHDGIIRLFAKGNSKVNIFVINLLNEKARNFIAIENLMEKDSKLNYTLVDFGGKNSITNYYSNVIGENADNQLNTIYLGKDNQLFDLNYIVELRGIKSNVDIDVQGALKDNAIKHFKGTIDFKRGCKKATGDENESCMILSDKAKSFALPMLLCSEEDVQGNHSSSAGKVGEKELFYIMTRGFDKKAGMKLLVRAKFNKILDNIKDENIKHQIIGKMDKILD